jgi:hypothetical protein
MLFLPLLLAVLQSVTLDDIAIGIWSGVEVFTERVLPMSRTWFRLVPSLHVYSDELVNTSLEAIVNCTNHLNLFFHETPTFSHYMVGSQWDNKWNNVQNRHLYSLGDLYFREPDKKWYFLGDDDTFLYPNVLAEFLSSVPDNDTHIHGRIFHAFDHVNFVFRERDSDHLFVQGGAGIVIPAEIMRDLAPKMENCTQMFSGVNFPSDMRLSACLERLFNYSVDPGVPGVFVHAHGMLNGDTPMREVAVWQRPPITYHHIVPPLIEQVWMGAFSLWTDAAGIDVYVDWSWIAMKEMPIELGSEYMWCECQFGFKFYLGGRNGVELTVMSHPEPVFDPSDKELRNPVKFIQKFEGNIVVVYLCFNGMANNIIEFDSFLLEQDGCAFRMMCPPARAFPVNHPGTQSPLNVTRSPIHEL